MDGIPKHPYARHRTDGPRDWPKGRLLAALEAAKRSLLYGVPAVATVRRLTAIARERGLL
jgi:hypothetical protein